MKQEKILLDISYSAIIKIIIAFLVIVFLFAIRDIIVLGFVVLVLLAALSPIVNHWSKYMPRILALIILFTIIIGVFGLITYAIVPPLVSQLQGLGGTLQDAFADNSKISASQKIIDVVSNQLDKIGSVLSDGLFKTTASVLTGLVSFITVFVLIFYLLADQESIKKLAIEYLPINRKEQIIEALRQVGEKMGGWLLGQLTLMVIIGLINGLILLIMGIPYALALGLWCGLTELIPYIGPILGMIVALVVAFASTGNLLIPLIILIAFMLVQQLEANFLVPKIMGKAVGLSPVIIIFAILIGGKLFGLTGVILAVPAAAVVSVLVKEWPNLKLAKG